jgi:hypothetical protein
MIITGSALFTLGQTPDTGSRGSMWYNKYTCFPSLQYSYGTAPYSTCTLIPTHTTPTHPTSQCPPPQLTWSTGGNMNVARAKLGGAGSQNAAIAAAGYQTTSPFYSSATETYNGTSWTTGGALSVNRYAMALVGAPSVALIFGGEGSSGGAISCTEKYNGTSWSTANALLNASQTGAGAGTQNSAIAISLYCNFGGSGVSEKYNGTSWTSAANNNVYRQSLAAAGNSQNSAIAFGGYYGPTCTEIYNGSSWSNVSAMNTGRQRLAGAGTQNQALAIGGEALYSFTTVACTEVYNGISWYTNGSLGTTRQQNGGAGNNSNSGLTFGGFLGSGGQTTSTQEFN